MVISQPAVVCLRVTVTHSAERAAAAGDRFRRLLPHGVRPRPAVRPFTSAATLPDLPEFRTRSVHLRAEL